jgi:phage tail sheath protein FI
MAADALASALAAKWNTVSLNGQLLNKLVTVTVPANSAQLEFGFTTQPSPQDPTQTMTFAVVVTPGGSASATGARLTFDGPEAISNTGVAELGLSPSATVTLTGTVAEGNTFTLVLSPPGSPAVLLSYVAKAGDTDVQVYAKLAEAVTKGASRLCTASAGNGLTLTYQAAFALAAEVSGQATLNVTLAQPLFALTAADPGEWGNELSATLNVIPAGPLYTKYGLDPSNQQQALFNLSISWFDGTSYQTESFLNVTLAGDATQSNRLDKVLEDGSQFVRCAIPNSLPSIPQSTIAVGFASGGVDSAALQVSDYTGDAASQTGLYALSQLPYGFNILCVPPDDVQDADGGDQDAAVYQEAAQLCVANNAVLIIDPPKRWYSLWQSGQVTNISINDPALGGYTADQARSAAVYFPRVVIADPLMNGQPKVLPPCGFMAAAWASTDAAAGVWKAPAGLDVPVAGVVGLQANLTDSDSGELNPQGINAIRQFSVGGNVVWGARTAYGSDTLNDEYKYLPVRRLLLYIETSLQFATRWAVFQPNGASLWARLQTQINTFMAGLFAKGAFAGTSASQAFFVKCDASTTLPSDQAAGIVNVQVGFAPLYPAEFVVITVSQQTASKSS